MNLKEANRLEELKDGLLYMYETAEEVTNLNVNPLSSVDL